MNVINLDHHGNKEYISKTVEEYCILIRLSSPSDIELKRIEKIMELAVYDVELNNLINREDEQYATENNLLGDDYLDKESSSSLDNAYPKSLSEINNKDNSDEVKHKSKYSSQKSDSTSNVVFFPRLVNSNPEKRKFLGFDINLNFVIYSFVAGGILACFGVAELHNSFNNEKELSTKHYSIFPSQFHENIAPDNTNNYLLSHVDNTEEMTTCNPNNDVPSQKIKKYYESFKQLENQIEAQELQASEIKSEVRELQHLAERQQRKAEENQRYAEIKKKQAEIQHHYDKAQKLKDEAQTLFSESQQWLCLSRQALTLSIH